MHIGDQNVAITASDVPNNPIQELVDAINLAACGRESQVWWNLEPDGYFMCFKPVRNEILFQLEFAPDSQRRLAESILSVRSSPPEILLPFWRFLREFQSHDYKEPHWPEVNYEHLLDIKAKLSGFGNA